MKRVHGWILENEMCTVSCYIIFKYMTNIIIFKYSSMEFLDYLYVKLYSYMERCLIWMLYPYTIFVLHDVWMNTTKYEAFWEKLVCASAGCSFVPCTAARRYSFPIRDCQRTGQWDARTQYVEETSFSTFDHPSRLLHVHALQLVHTKRWTTFSLLLIDRRPQAHQICI
jgi:hypothetical protein